MFRRVRKHTQHGAVRKSEQHVTRNMFFKLSSLLLMLAMIITLGWLVRDYQPQTVMPIEHISIEGSFHNLAENDMQARVLAVLNGGYFTVDLKVIRDALLMLPWVDDVSVRRQWPSALSIRVTEKRAVAYWGKNSLISDKGELFTPEQRFENLALTKLDGPDGLHKKVWQFATEVAGHFDALGLDTEKVTLDARRAWRVFVADSNAELADRQLIEISLGKAETIARLRRFINVFAMRNAPELKNIQVVDMRYPNGFAMRSNIKKESGA